jgi:hypothetical protein
VEREYTAKARILNIGEKIFLKLRKGRNLLPKKMPPLKIEHSGSQTLLYRRISQETCGSTDCKQTSASSPF